MKRLSLLLDEVAFIRSALKNKDFDPVQFGILAETSGANGLVCTYFGKSNGITERDLRLLKEIRKTFFSIRIPVQEDALRLVLSLSPDMVTFVEVTPTHPFSVQPIDTTLHLDTIQQMLPDLQANNIPVSVLIEPEINILKNVNKLEMDYVEIDVTGYTEAENINDELLFLDKIKSATIAAVKLGMGVNCSGNISFEHISELAKIPNLEDIIIGGQIVQRSIYVGVEKAVSEALQLIRHREID